MIGKIVFTIAVIAAVVLYVQLRRRRMPSIEAAAGRDQGRADNDGFRWLAFFAVLLMLVGSAFFIYLEWRESTEVVELRVVDASSGRSVTYQAYRSDIGEGGFRTVDGRRIVLAQTERLELGGVGAD